MSTEISSSLNHWSSRLRRQVLKRALSLGTVMRRSLDPCVLDTLICSRSTSLVARRDHNIDLKTDGAHRQRSKLYQDSTTACRAGACPSSSSSSIMARLPQRPLRRRQLVHRRYTCEITPTTSALVRLQYLLVGSHCDWKLDDYYSPRLNKWMIIYIYYI